MQRLYPFNHPPMQFYFRQSPADFVVKEHNLYDFSGEGEHDIFYIRKKNLTTWEMTGKLAKYLKIPAREIGYCGLKDKNALTYQYISINKKFTEGIENFESEGIKIIERFVHNNKLKIGHLRGNSFFVRLKRVKPAEASKLQSLLGWIEKEGMPNYFGAQRFGRDNLIKAKEIIEGTSGLRDKKQRKFLLNAYQSDIFNAWLAKRVEMSRYINEFSPQEAAQLCGFDSATVKTLQKQKPFFKLLQGELMMHYPFGKIFILDDVQRFQTRDIAPTGPLFGKKMRTPEGDALGIEQAYEQPLPLDGGRRYGWVFPQDISHTYKSDLMHLELSFTLPKGSYATVLVEMLKNALLDL
ncbi:MAG: tRNA pseudouridine(13) synthase TruD [Campylobacterota bacterium]